MAKEGKTAKKKVKQTRTKPKSNPKSIQLRAKYTGEDLYNILYLHSRYATFNLNARSYLNQFKNRNSNELLSVMAKNSKRQLDNFAVGLGLDSGEELCKLLKDYSSEEGIKATIKSFYDDGAVAIQDILKRGTAEKLLTQIYNAIQSNDTRAALASREKKLTSFSQDTQRKIFYAWLDSLGDLTNNQRAALKIFFAGNQKQGFKNFINLISALRRGRKSFKHVDLASFIDQEGVSSVLKGIANEYAVPKVVDEIRESSINAVISSLESQVVGAKKSAGVNKTQKVDVEIYAPSSSQLQKSIGISAKNISVPKGKNLVQFKLEETSDLNWIVNRFKANARIAKVPLDEQYFNFLEYLIINTTYLNKKGQVVLSIDGKEKTFQAKPVAQDTMRDYYNFINLAFSQFAAIFIGAELTEPGKDEALQNGIIMDYSRGIVMPVWKVLLAIQETLKSPAKQSLISQSFEMGALSDSPVKVRNKKLNVLTKKDQDGYPEKLRRIGTSYGQQAKAKIKTKVYFKGEQEVLNIIKRMSF